jgi:hypothetical protein
VKVRNLSYRWCLIVGGFGFLIGFIGPMIFAPGANQGPLLGIFITGPIGFMLGAVGWALSSFFRWSYDLQMRGAIACCVLITCGLIWAALQPKPEWPGRVYEIQVTACSPSSHERESALETVILHEWQIKKENSLFKPSFYTSGEITYPRPTTPKHSFYAPGTCAGFPVGFTGTYYVTNHPKSARDKAVLSPVPDFAKGLQP